MLPVCSGATLCCTCGVGPSTLRVPARGLSYEKNHAAATVADYKPLINIQPFPACTSAQNPQPPVAAGRVCLPSFTAPWTTQVASIRLFNVPVLDDSSTILCIYGGLVRIANPGQGFASHTPESLKGS